MVIIKKPIAKRFRQWKSNKSFLRVTAVVLSLVMLLSGLAIAIPLVSAKGETAFTDCEEIYIDMRDFTDWTNDSAAFRVFTFFNDSDDLHYCHEFAGNFDNDDWYTGANVLQAGIKAVKFCDNVYSFRIPSDKLSHLRIVRTSSDSKEKWNLSPYMWDNQRKKTAGNRNNCVKITDWNNSATWTTFTPTNNASYAEKTANTVSNKSSSVTLFNIDATLYDYYTDDEVQNGWESIRYQSGHSYWEPYQYLNNKIASASSGITYPLYFGNFYGKNDSYAGEGASKMSNFVNKVNNSSNLGGANKSVLGLTGGKLDDDDDLVYAADGGVNSSVKVPIFNKSFLSTNKVGSVVNTKFPMRVTTDSAGNTQYVFDSGANDNVWLSQDKTTVYYGQGTSYGAKDALAYYSAPQEASGYGFFPFDYNRGASAEAYNFGFGMRTDIKFNVGQNGLLAKGNGHEVFEFTGDDDLWVYLDGVLVLDLGGDHKKAHGTIDFNTLTSTVTTGSITFNDATRNDSFPQLFGTNGNETFNNKDVTAEHTLTMFYVERGMVESNLSFNFNFSPIGNELVVDKTVNVANVNKGLKTAVAAADTFSFNQPTANGKTSSKGTISNSTYTLRDNESISFKDQFDVPTSTKVTESYSSYLTYTTSWKAIDLVLQSKGKTESEYKIAGSASGADSKEASFTYKTKDTSSEFAMTRVQLSYVNTPAVADVMVDKFVITGDGSGISDGDYLSDGSSIPERELDDTEFNATVTVQLKSGEAFKPYQLTYTADDKDGQTFTTSATGALDSRALLKDGRVLTFKGIPVGARFRVVENNIPAGYSFDSVDGADVTSGNGGYAAVLADEGAYITVVNKQKSGNGSIYVTKTIDGESYTGEQFSFKAEGVEKTGFVKGADADSGSAESGVVEFEFNFTKPGTYLYKITENNLSSALTEKGYKKSNSVFYAKFDVASGADGLEISGEPKFYSNEACTTEVNPVFNNTTEHARIIVNKTDPTGIPIENTIFAVVKVKDTTPLSKAQIDDLIDNYSAYYDTGDTQADGTVVFDDLAIFQNGDWVYDNSAPVGSPEQWLEGDSYFNGVVTSQTYLVFEFSPTNGYNTNNTTKFVTFPYQNNYSITFDYTNVAVVDPASGGSGMQLFLMIGFGVFGTGLLMAAAYVLYDRRVRAANKARHGKRIK